MESEVPSTARKGLKVLGVETAPSTKRPPVMPGWHSTTKGLGGKPWPCGTLGLLHAESARQSDAIAVCQKKSRMITLLITEFSGGGQATLLFTLVLLIGFRQSTGNMP